VWERMGCNNVGSLVLGVYGGVEVRLHPCEGEGWVVILQV